VSDSENPAIDAPEPKSGRPRTNQDWWPDQLDLSVLNQHVRTVSPWGEDFDYGAEFETLDLAAVKRDIVEVMTTSQDWWPADYGHYGGLFIRLAWHSAGTYRMADGRGGGGTGSHRLAPLNSWPDNANLDKARRLLWPVKQKYGRKLSWADLIILAGNVAIEDMGGPIFGFGGGREDAYEPQQVFWGTEDTWVGDERYSGDAPLDFEDNPFGAVSMGLIYVNPEGPRRSADPMAAAHDIRLTFGLMAMDDEETVALIAGGHTFGKAHGAGDPDAVGPEPEGCPLHAMGIGWVSSFGSGKGADTITSGLEGSWTNAPTTWDNGFFDNLFGYEWELSTSPAGAKQWRPTNPEAQEAAPHSHLEGTRVPPMMATTDIALKTDPSYLEISKRFHENPDQFADAFARAWFKLTHRDMGPIERYRGPEVPTEELVWQDPVPAGTTLSDADVAKLKEAILASDLTVGELVAAAWASAATYRGTDKRGGTNGGRVRLAPQKDWPVNDPGTLAKVLSTLEGIQQGSGTSVSMADLIVLGGCAAIEKASGATVPFRSGRGDASAEQTDADSFVFLEPRSDGFRNHHEAGVKLPPENRLLERANLLTLTAPEMTALVGGLRVLGANTGGSTHGVFTDRVGTLTNDFFVTLLDPDVTWAPSVSDDGIYEGTSRSGEAKGTATSADLVFGGNSQLRAISEVYGSADGNEKFVADFVAAWAKVMELGRFDRT
jgi:catalase-peroxidase